MCINWPCPCRWTASVGGQMFISWLCPFSEQQGTRLISPDYALVSEHQGTRFSSLSTSLSVKISGPGVYQLSVPLSANSRGTGLCPLSQVHESEEQELSGVSADSAPVREQDEARSVSMLLLGSSMGSAVFQRTMSLPGNSMGPVVLYQMIMTLSGTASGQECAKWLLRSLTRKSKGLEV
jgi:hypothetical protein